MPEFAAYLIIYMVTVPNLHSITSYYNMLIHNRQSLLLGYFVLTETQMRDNSFSFFLPEGNNAPNRVPDIFAA